MIVRCPDPTLSTNVVHDSERDNERAATMMVHPMGPSLTAELEYRRARLVRTGRGTVPAASRGTRRAQRSERAAQVALAERAACAHSATPCGPPATVRTRAA